MAAAVSWNRTGTINIVFTQKNEPGALSKSLENGGLTKRRLHRCNNERRTKTMKKWKMLKKMGLSKKEAKLAAYLLDLEKFNCVLRGIAEDLEMEEDEVRKTLEDLRNIRITVTREKPHLHQEAILLDFCIYGKNGEMPEFVCVNTALGATLRTENDS